MEDKFRITPEFLKNMDCDKKYHLLDAASSSGEQVAKILDQIMCQKKMPGIVCRFFDNERLLHVLLSGTDRLTDIISADPALERYRPMHEEQVEIMRRRDLKAGDIIWGLHTKRADLVTTVDKHLGDGQSVSVYDPDQLEKLGTSFARFKGNAQGALLGVFGHEELFKA